MESNLILFIHFKKELLQFKLEQLEQKSLEQKAIISKVQRDVKLIEKVFSEQAENEQKSRKQSQDLQDEIIRYDKQQEQNTQKIDKLSKFSSIQENDKVQEQKKLQQARRKNISKTSRNKDQSCTSSNIKSKENINARLTLAQKEQKELFKTKEKLIKQQTKCISQEKKGHNQKSATNLSARQPSDVNICKLSKEECYQAKIPKQTQQNQTQRHKEQSQDELRIKPNQNQLSAKTLKKTQSGLFVAIDQITIQKPVEKRNLFQIQINSNKQQNISSDCINIQEPLSERNKRFAQRDTHHTNSTNVNTSQDRDLSVEKSFYDIKPINYKVQPQSLQEIKDILSHYLSQPQTPVNPLRHQNSQRQQSLEQIKQKQSQEVKLRSFISSAKIHNQFIGKMSYKQNDTNKKQQTEKNAKTPKNNGAQTYLQKLQPYLTERGAVHKIKGKLTASQIKKQKSLNTSISPKNNITKRQETIQYQQHFQTTSYDQVQAQFQLPTKQSKVSQLSKSKNSNKNGRIKEALKCQLNSLNNSINEKSKNISEYKCESARQENKNIQKQSFTSKMESNFLINQQNILNSLREYKNIQQFNLKKTK